MANTFARAPGTRRPVFARRMSPAWPFFRLSRGAYTGFINAFYDDEGWWALAWLDAYDLTGEDKYLAAANDIFLDMAAGWDDYWGGGIYWGKYDGGPDRTGACAVPHGWTGGYKNAIANELFIAVAAGLGLRYRGRGRRHGSASTGSASTGWLARVWLARAARLPGLGAPRLGLVQLSPARRGGDDQ